MKSALLLSFLASATAFVPVVRHNNLVQLGAGPHDAEAGKGASWSGARLGDEFLAIPTGGTGSGSTSANAMDAAAQPRPRSSHTGHAYSASETHGATSANAQDAGAMGGKGAWLKKLGQ